MPKRKRTANDDGDRVQHMRKQDVQDALTKGRKQLNRALKIAKGFERQKLGKRLKLATTNGENEAVARINREIVALKGLELGQLTNTHIQKSLLKIKVFAENENLPDELKTEIPKPDGDEAMITAIRNVTSGMYSMKPVKDAMEQTIHRMYIAMGIPAPTKEKGKKKVEVKGILKNGGLSTSKLVEKQGHGPKDESVSGAGELSWDGFSSREEEEGLEGKKEQEDESMDEEEIARYDTLIGGSSDEKSFDEEKYRGSRPSQAAERLSLSLSPTPSASPTLSGSLSSASSSSSEPERTKATRPTRSKEKPFTSTKPALSTFLPTLMGGYWSGSESSASDLEDVAPIRKNRPGQMARRAIWEKKYGEKANHITTGKGPVGKNKDDGWDAKRGAKDSSRGRGGFSGRGGHEGGRARILDRATGENAIAVEPKKRGMGRKDDAGVLHPSWQAAKKAKEAKKTATFQGKKVTFN